jgi:hypothetical protein
MCEQLDGGEMQKEFVTTQKSMDGPMNLNFYLKNRA